MRAALDSFSQLWQRVSMQTNVSLKKRPKVNSRVLPATLAEVLKEASEKIRADQFRFRTCCADPRASK